MHDPRVHGHLPRRQGDDRWTRHRLASAVVKSFAPAERTLPAMLRAAGRAATANGRCVSAGEQTWTLSPTPATPPRALRGALRAAGVGRGDRVAVICSNRIELIEVVLGCAWLGAVAVPINTASTRPQLAAHPVELRRAAAGDRSGLRRRSAHARCSASCALEAIWVIGDDGGRCACGARPSRTPRCRAASRARSRPRRSRPGDPRSILYTSGTTGPSKGVCCPHAQYFWWGVNTAPLLGCAPTTCSARRLPLFHTNALNTFFQALLTGARVAREALLGLGLLAVAGRRARATVTYLLGAMVPILLAQPASHDETRASRAHRARARRAGAVPRASSRGAPASACSTATARPRPTSCIGTTDRAPAARHDGPAVPRASRRASSTPTTTRCRTATAGELVLRADEPFAFATGYFGMPEKTVEAWRNLLVPHRRPRRPRRRRLLPLRRPAQGRDPPARREHLLLRGRAGAAQPSGGRERRGLSGALASSPRTR